MSEPIVTPNTHPVTHSAFQRMGRQPEGIPYVPRSEMAKLEEHYIAASDTAKDSLIRTLAEALKEGDDKLAKAALKAFEQYEEEQAEEA